MMEIKVRRLKIRGPERYQLTATASGNERLVIPACSCIDGHESHKAARDCPEAVDFINSMTGKP